MRIAFLTFLLAGVVVRVGVAQERSLTQFFSVPLTINPAMTGLIAGDMRVATNYNYRWVAYTRATIQNVNASYDMPLLKGKLPKGDALGAGIFYQNRVVDEKPELMQKSTTTGLSVAYHKSLGKNKRHHLSLGAQVAYANNSLIYNIPTINIYDARYAAYRNYNVGIMYSGILSEKVGICGGIARYNTSYPVEIYEQYNQYPLTVRNTVNIGSSIRLYKNAVLYTSFFYHIEKLYWLPQLSSYARIVLNPKRKTSPKNDIAAYAGVLFSVEDDFVPYIGIEIARTRVGFSYSPGYVDNSTDFSFNKFQLSLIYIGRLSKKQNSNWHCPSIL